MVEIQTNKTMDIYKCGAECTLRQPGTNIYALMKVRQLYLDHYWTCISCIDKVRFVLVDGFIPPTSTHIFRTAFTHSDWKYGKVKYM